MRKLIFVVLGGVLLCGALAWAADLDDGVMRLLLIRPHKHAVMLYWPGTTDAVFWPATTDPVLWP